MVIVARAGQCQSTGCYQTSRLPSNINPPVFAALRHFVTDRRSSTVGGHFRSKMDTTKIHVIIVQDRVYMVRWPVVTKRKVMA